MDDPSWGNYRRRGGCVFGSRIFLWPVSVVVVALLLAVRPAVSAEAPAPLRVLTLYSLDPAFPWQAEVERGIVAGFARLDRPVERFVENLDTARFPGEAQAEVVEHFLAGRFVGGLPDVVIAEGGPATRFIKARPGLFPGARRVLINYTGEPGPDMVAIPLRSDFRTAIAEMLTVSGTRRVTVVADASDPSGKARLDDFKTQMAAFGSDIRVEYLVDRPMAELRERLAELPRDSAVFYLLVFHDGAGEAFTPYQAAQRLAAVSKAPIFSHWSSLMGSGIVGGYLLSGERVGTLAADAAGQLVAGRSGREVALPLKEAYGSSYDWRRVKDWGIPEARLPMGSVPLFREPSFWAAYRWPAIMVLSLTLVLATVVVVLARLNAARRQALAALDEERSLLERRVEERTADLSAATAALERSNQDLQQFAYAASHDLQEPLRSVTGYLQLLERRIGPTLDADAREFITFAVEGGRRMHTMIADLLEYSRVHLDGAAAGPVNAEKALGLALDNLRGLIDASGARIGNTPLPLVLASAPQVTRLFQNLVGNAIKYADPARPPEVTIGADCDGEFWQFSVKDNGIGIPKQFHQRIFWLFQRLHARSQYQGTGVGLALCQRIVERHGGHIWVESEPGKGATFRFTLPVARDSADLARAEV